MRPAISPLRPVVDALESAAALDPVGEKAGRAIRRVLAPGALKDALSGTWLGHALHPILTDVVIGCFVSATLLDVLGGDEDGGAAERLIAIGIAAYGPTALTGAGDWADSEPADERVRRVGLVHAAGNGAALTLYVGSLAARRRGNRGAGTLLGLAGAGALGAAGWLGGHMSLVQGVGANQTAFDAGPADWTDAGAAADLGDGEPTRVVAGETPVLLVRHGGALLAIHDRCSHRGCSLSEGELDGDSIVCPCHDSRFGLRDGVLQRGPATTDQPAYDVRESDGRIEVRLQRKRD